MSSAVAFLGIRTPTLPLARGALAGIVGLGMAGICSLICPDPHFLNWWAETSLGSSILRAAGPAASAACFGLVATLVFGLVSAIVALVPRDRGVAAVAVPAMALVLMLLPAVALQSVGTSFGAFAGLFTGTAVGACVGIAAGVRVRKLFHRN